MSIEMGVETVELFIEVRCEEIPARFVAPAMEGFAAGLKKLLGTLVVGDVVPFSTPRRLALAAQVQPVRPTSEKIVTGMPIAQARAGDAWSPAALGFAKKRGVEPTALFEHNGFAAIRVTEGGGSTAQLVAAGLESVVLGIPFKKTMRWGTEPARFARPLHDVLCLLDGQRVVATVAGVQTTDLSVGHWLLSPETFPVAESGRWLADLRARQVYADRAERHARVAGMLAEAALLEGVELLPDAALLDEVVDLVESPRVIVGRFPVELLRLPPRLLIESMKVNQRYFPLFERSPGGPGSSSLSLSNRFLVVANNPEGNAALIAEGNARVLSARFHDAKFFFAEDRKVKLHEHAAKLGGAVWRRGLGNMADWQAALSDAAARLAPHTGADVHSVRTLGKVLKADLTTLMVGEFPELQGHVGHLLAAAEGYANALAIEEAWLPRFSGDALPTTPEGYSFALAERIYLLSACFAADMEPKGSADPYGLRRAAVGLVALVLAWPAQPGELPGSLEQIFARAGVALPPSLADFVVARLRATLLAEGHPIDLVDAVLAGGGSDLGSIAARVRGLSALPKDELAGVRTTFRRVAGLGKDHASSVYTLDLLQGEAEYRLHVAVKALPSGSHPDELLEALRGLRPIVDRFFDEVLVMCDDLPLRANRLGLLRTILDRFVGFADFARLGGD